MPNVTEVTTSDALLAELQRQRRRATFIRIIKQNIAALLAIVSLVALIATLLFPVLVIEGESMAETLHDGDVVIANKSGHYQIGQIIGLYHNNEILVKRVIANAGQWVDIDENGYVYVDGNMLDEPYVNERARGDCDIVFPYQVPEGCIFVLGDHRATSIDSRYDELGSVKETRVLGHIMFRIWPLRNIGIIK